MPRHPLARGLTATGLVALTTACFAPRALAHHGLERSAYPDSADYPSTPSPQSGSGETPLPSPTASPEALPPSPSPSATPAPAPTATPVRTPLPTPAPTVAPDLRVPPKALTAAPVSSRDATAPYAFRIVGALVPPDGISARAACDGTVQIRVTRSTGSSLLMAEVGIYRATLRLTHGTCGIDRRITLPDGTKPNSGRLRGTVTFPGNATLKPKDGPTFALHAGRR